MPKLSAGLLLFRRADDGVEVLIAHPGGPIWSRRDDGAWSLPKGATIEHETDLLETARREFQEETGHAAPDREVLDLGEVRMRSGKVVHGYAVEGDLDPTTIRSMLAEVEWPPRSGRIIRVPEIDRVLWARPDEARRRLNPAQASFVDRLLQALAQGGGSTPVTTDIWAEGDAYERSIGRWSRPVAREFVGWLGVAPGSTWLDVGCGTGALVEAILQRASPASVLGVDRSPGFVGRARQLIGSPLASFVVGDALALPVPNHAVDAVASGLVLNFAADPLAMVAEMAQKASPRGAVGLYVWDYAEGMQLLRAFWDAARAVDPGSRSLDEGLRFPICAPDRLEALFTSAGLVDVATRAIEIRTVFADFDDLWTPFLGGQGPGPAYAAGLPEDTRQVLREELRRSLPIAADGSIGLEARAWAVMGRTTD